MEARSERAPDRNKTTFGRLQADMAKRETRMLLAVAGMIGLAIAIPGLLIAQPIRFLLCRSGTWSTSGSFGPLPSLDQRTPIPSCRHESVLFGHLTGSRSRC